MSELGDSFREWREGKKAYRRTLVSCWRCDTKNEQDSPCRNCEPIEYEEYIKSKMKERKKS